MRGAILLSICFFVFQCDKSRLPGDYFIFGIADDVGDTYYLIKNGKVYADKNKPGTVFGLKKREFRHKSQSLSTKKFQIAKQVFDALPDFLIAHPNETLANHLLWTRVGSGSDKKRIVKSQIGRLTHLQAQCHPNSCHM